MEGAPPPELVRYSHAARRAVRILAFDFTPHSPHTQKATLLHYSTTPLDVRALRPPHPESPPVALSPEQPPIFHLSRPMQSSLLSPAESHAFQSFLSTMDYPDNTLTPSEWAIYHSNAPMYDPHDDPLDERAGTANPAQREALAKATKDLMSLEPDGWNRDGAMMEGNGGQRQSQIFDPRGHYDSQHQHRQLEDHHHFAQRQQALQHLQQQQQHQQHQQQHQLQQEQQHRQNSFSSGNDLFPFLHNNKVSASQELRYPMQRHQLSHLGPSPMTSNSDHGSPTSPHSPFNFSQPQHNLRSLGQQQPQHQLRHPHQVHIPAHPDQQRRQQQQQQQLHQQSRLSPGPSSNARNAKHSSNNASNNVASTSANGGRSNGASNGHPSSSNTANNKRQRASASPSSASHALPSSMQPGQGGQAAGSAPKQALLSPSQKKANHIQSEQKRRANIRRGYEALCETVPSLREAIREEEEAERMAALAGGRGSTLQRKKNRGKKGAKDGDEKEKDRLDGRAGPRSENVVLSKTIEHIQALIADRSALLARLHRARSSLPPGHPALTPLMPDPPWEREWKGGIGRLGDDDGDGSDGEGEDDEDE